jgi:hypothetical protein
VSTVLVLPILAEYCRTPGKGLPGLVGVDMEEAASFLMIVTLFTAVAFTWIVDGRQGVRIILAAHGPLARRPSVVCSGGDRAPNRHGLPRRLVR